MGASLVDLQKYRDWLETQPSKGRWVEPEEITTLVRNDRSMMDPISTEDIDEHLDNYGGTREEAERELRLYRGAGVMAMWTRTPGSPRISEVLFSEAGSPAQKMLAARTLKSVLEGWNASGVEPRLQAVQLYNFGFPDAMAEQLSGATLPFNETMPKPSEPTSRGIQPNDDARFDIRFAPPEIADRIERTSRGYLTADTADLTGFINFQNPDLDDDGFTPLKAHISISADDLTRIEPDLLDLLQETGVAAFKLASPELRVQMDSPDEPQRGKVVTLYDHAEAPIQPIADRIESFLADQGVAPMAPPSTNTPLGRYVSMRDERMPRS
jgi:hypothetical protein